MGSVVVKDVGCYQVVGGNPAKFIFKRDINLPNINPTFKRF